MFSIPAPRRYGVLLLVVAVLTACSATSNVTPPPTDSATPTTAASATGSPAQATSSTEPSGLDRWSAFKEKATAYVARASTLREFTDKWLAGDKDGALAIAAELSTESRDLIAWLDANPAHACYEPSWEYLREAADHIADGAASYQAGDAEAGSEAFMEGGSALIDAGGSISDSGDACRAAS